MLVLVIGLAMNFLEAIDIALKARNYCCPTIGARKLSALEIVRNILYLYRNSFSKLDFYL